MSSESPRARAFSLLEVVIAAAILMSVAATVLTSLSFSAAGNANSRVRTIAASEAQMDLDRMLLMSNVVIASGGDTDVLCSMYTAAGGPMDASTAASVVGSCPTALGSSMTVIGIPIVGTALRRDVTIENALLGNASGLIITITVRGGQLKSPVVITTHIKI